MPYAKHMQELLTLDRVSDLIFKTNFHQITPRGFLYGGQLLGQALIAGANTVADDRVCHFLSACFISGTSGDDPVHYYVDIVRDGRSFSHRRVVAKVNEQTLFSTELSFHHREEGYQHQFDIDIPQPPTEKEALQSVIDFKNFIGLENHTLSPMTNLFYCVPINNTPLLNDAIAPPYGSVWVKSIEPLIDKQQNYQASLAVASDIGLPNTAMFPHPSLMFDGKQTMASLNHNIWFHTPIQLNEWLLHKTDSPWAGAARGFSRGLVYNSRGTLVASTSQENLIRPLS